MKHAYVFILISIFSTALFAQQPAYRVEQRMITDTWTVDPHQFKEDFHVSVTNLEAPYPGGEAARGMIKERKLESAKLFPRKPAGAGGAMRDARQVDDSLSVLDSFAVRFFLNDVIMTGGTPNDNTLAISDDNMLLTSYNTQVWGYDLDADTFLFEGNIKHPSFTQFVNNYTDTAYSLNFPFDPKLIYDPVRDRFILVFLTGRNPNNSAAIVCFSSTNYPSDEWYAYRLSGDPLNDSTWTDYPQIAINDNSLYLTLNQLYPDSSWITGFAQTVIWQMDLDAGFSGAGSLPVNLWSGVNHEGSKLRYLHPVKTGMGPESDSMFFMVDRPFDIQNDSFFLVSIVGDVGDTNATMNVELVGADLEYGLPPDAIQPNGHTFLTNDARILGAVRVDKEIQFVGNTVDANTGRAAIYHGRIADIDNASVAGRIITHPELDFGYPNIDFLGLSDTDREMVIFFNHSSATHNAGNSAVYVDNAGNYGPIQVLAEGTTHVDRINGTDERWGDYIGLQRKYNATSRAWAAGYISFGNASNGTWVSELAGPRDWTVGTGSEPSTPKTRVFPNPTLDLVSFRFNMPKQGEATIAIYDQSGRMVNTLARDRIKKGQNELTFDLTPLSHGVYFVRITGASGQVVLNEKVIKQ